MGRQVLPHKMAPPCHLGLKVFPQTPLHSQAVTLLINSCHSLHVRFASEQSIVKPAAPICVKEFDLDPPLFKSESDPGPEIWPQLQSGAALRFGVTHR